ncbi:MAG: hypothetical protein K6F33_10895 [Bacteroidales bacterium]|nr:hypothetical protein [Bacteroidales bacterium]
MKTTHIYMVIALLVTAMLVGCGNSGQPREQANVSDAENEEPPVHRNPVLSLYESDSSFFIYRNSDKIATFTLESGRVPIQMRSQNGDSFILVSESRATDSAGSKRKPAEIFKNGRPIMELDSNLKALNFDMSERHFYVLGQLGDSVYTVYRDGLRVHSFPVGNGGKLVDMCVFQQEVYIARQRGKTVDVYKNSKKISSLPGTCVDFRVSLRGVYMLMPDTLYLDSQIIMHEEYYRNADKELYANPTHLATSDKNVIVGGRARLDKSRTYATIFHNKQTYATIKPDDKHIGDSEFCTKCCGVAISDETLYYVTTNISPDGELVQPLRYDYYTDHSASFSIQFDHNEARLLMIVSD